MHPEKAKLIRESFEAARAKGHHLIMPVEALIDAGCDLKAVSEHQRAIDRAIHEGVFRRPWWKFW